MSGLNDNEIIKALECCSTDEACCSECPYIYIGTLNGCYDVTKAKSLDLIIRLKEEKEALIAGQETLQKSLAEKDKEIKILQERNVILKGLVDTQKAEIEKLKAENEILQKNADEAFQEGLNENRGLFVKEVIQEIQQIICDNTYPGADSSGKAVMIWKARTGYDAIKDAVLKKVGDAE